MYVKLDFLDYLINCGEVAQQIQVSCLLSVNQLFIFYHFICVYIRHIIFCIVVCRVER